MNHLERLVRRALAVPRDRPQGVFDPFDQSLPWAVDAIAARPDAAPATRPEDRVVAPAQSTLPRPGNPPAAAARATAPAPVSSSAPAAGPPAMPASVSASRGPQQPAAVAALAPQARADAFMRALGVATPQVEAPVSAAPAPAAGAVSLEPLARPSTPPAAVPRETPSIRPVAPARAQAIPAPPRQRVPAPPTVASPAPAAAAPHRPGATQPAVQIIRTTPAAPRPPALDDLARGSHIVRFGIGQD